MALNKPYHRIYRPMVDGKSEWGYLHDKKYAIEPHHYTRSFMIIQKDIKNLFEYIEPADQNLKTFSFEIYQLLLRTATEIEANFKAILRENKYTPGRKGLNLNMDVYQRVNKSHHLDSYSAEFPIWTGEKRIFTPFKSWKTGQNPEWYKAYNNCKHDRVHNLHLANFENLLNAYCGLFILLSAQFGSCSYEPGKVLLVLENNYYKGNFGIGDYLIIRHPDNWIEEEYYDFNWNELKGREDRFNKFDYDALS